MGCASTNEILIVIVVVMLVLGINRLPQIGDALGRSIRNFKKGVRGENEIDVTPPKPQISDRDQKPNHEPHREPDRAPHRDRDDD